MCFRHWNRPRGSPDVRNGFVLFNDPRRISSPRDTQKAYGIMSRRSIVDSVIPLLVKGFTIHSQIFSRRWVQRKGSSPLSCPRSEREAAKPLGVECGRLGGAVEEPISAL